MKALWGRLQQLGVQSFNGLEAETDLRRVRTFEVRSPNPKHGWDTYTLAQKYSSTWWVNTTTRHFDLGMYREWRRGGSIYAVLDHIERHLAKLKACGLIKPLPDADSKP